jgi:asparagine synthase (glutamine-hydrolysing)
MCGICGYLDFGNIRREVDQLWRMTDTLAHRGPDRRDVWVNGPAGLGHTRLSVIDLSSAGNQPMTSDDGRLVIVFNGEIYNFPDLRLELQRGGVRFRGHSDTEVALYAYQRWGRSAVRKFNGIFALAIWDLQHEELFLARDRFGVKPLYYHRLTNGIIFGSEVKSILASEQVVPALNPAGLNEFLYYGASLGRKTLYLNIYKVLPGHWLTCRAGSLSEESYWRLQDVEPVNDDMDTAIKTVRNRLETAVRRQLVSDVPIGVFLSGGIDSSAVVAFATRHYEGRLKTFSAGFDFDREVNELPKARRVANHFGTEHHEIRVKGASLPDVIEQLVLQHDEPFSDAANIPLLLMCRELNGQPKVILQGDGGDEIFGGYRRYKMLHYFTIWSILAHLHRVIPLLPRNLPFARRLRRVLDIFGVDDEGLRMALLLTVETRNAAPTRVLNADLRQEVENIDPFVRYREMYANFSRLDRVQRMLYTDIAILLPDVFMEKVDKSAMAYGIESRVPMLDHDLTDYVLGLPSRIKMRGGRMKYVLRQALRGVLPDEVLDGPKTGFGVPYGYWLRGPLHGYASEVLLAESPTRNSLFERRTLERLLQEHKLGAADHSFLLWKCMNLALWHKFFISQ